MCRSLGNSKEVFEVVIFVSSSLRPGGFFNNYQSDIVTDMKKNIDHEKYKPSFKPYSWTEEDRALLAPFVIDPD